MGLLLSVEVMSLSPAGFCGCGKSGLDPLVLLSAGSDWRCGIGFTLKRSANASIESTGPVGRDPNHASEGADREPCYLGHSDFTHLGTSE